MGEPKPRDKGYDRCYTKGLGQGEYRGYGLAGTEKDTRHPDHTH